MWTDLAAWALRFAPFGLVSGLCFALAGLVGIIAFRRSEVTMGPVPRKLTDPPTVVLPRVDSGVVARIPGATPEAGPVCPTCGGPFHSPCPSAPKERTEEDEPAAELAPPFAALGRFFAAVDQQAEVTDHALLRIVDALADRLPADDCPLTTQEIPPLDEATPVHAGIAGREPTQELSAALLEKVKAP